MSIVTRRMDANAWIQILDHHSHHVKTLTVPKNAKNAKGRNVKNLHARIIARKHAICAKIK